MKTDGDVMASDSSLTITHAKEAILYLINETSFNGFDKHPVKEGAPYLENAANDIWHTQNYSFEEFYARHLADYMAIYDRVKIDLGGSKETAHLSAVTSQLLKDYTDGGGKSRYIEELYFQYGRYLLISCSRTEGVPANLQGLWTPHLWSPWRGNYTVNINLEENYWPAFVANLSWRILQRWHSRLTASYNLSLPTVSIQQETTTASTKVGAQAITRISGQ